MPPMNDMQPIGASETVETPQKSFTRYLIAGVLVVLVAGLLWYVFLRDATPDLNYPYMPRADLPQSIQEESAAKVSQAKAELRDNPELMSRWLELAAQYKGVYDYEFAEEIFLYVMQKWPEEVTAYANLADMYRYELKQYEDSVTYWRKVIALKPDFIPAYRELHYLYRYNITSDETMIIAPLEEGLVANPDNTDLLIPFANYYRDVAGDITKAREYFLKARSAAKAAGNTRLIGQIDAELRALPQ